MEEFYPAALTIAGSDSGGGAGIQADLRTFSAFGVFGCSVVTAVTAQNPFEVRRVDPLPTESVIAQAEATLDKFSIKAAKTGMLFNASIIAALLPLFKRLNAPLVMDPVMVSTSGARLLEESAVDLLKEKALHLADWITPNIPEAELLTGKKISSLQDMADAAVECSEKWKCGCVLKGGHAQAKNNAMVDIVAKDGKIFELSSPEAKTNSTISTHGTGCTFSSALAAGLALEFSWKDALYSAKAFVYGSLKETVVLGKKLEAMYPPAESYIEFISLKKYKQKT